MQHQNSYKKEDLFDLKRFLMAQENVYSAALTELNAGYKRSHWMWFIFSQIDGLGHSFTTKKYSIESLDEAGEYLRHPIFGIRLKVMRRNRLANIRTYSLRDFRVASRSET